MKKYFLILAIFLTLLVFPQPSLSSSPKVFVQTGHSDDVRSVAFSPDGRYALSGSFDGTLRVWDIVSGIELRVIKGHRGSVDSVAFSPNGSYALSAGDKILRLWEIRTGRMLRVFKGHTWPVSSAAFSPDGRYALSGARPRGYDKRDLF